MDEALAAVGDTWERLAQVDPLWAVLSEPDKQGNRWDLEEFLRTGEEEIESLLADLRSFGDVVTGTALDFGCGVGRLSLPLSRHFDRVIGVDIAPTMIATARSLVGDGADVTFVVNDRSDLSFVDAGTVDLVYSNIVLQHMDPGLAETYIREFYRIVRPGGFVVFQIPSHLTDDWLPGGNDGTVLPDTSCDAAISIRSAPAEMEAGRRATVTARVRNVSAGEWTQDLTNQINLGNHWLDTSGAMLLNDDGRARLPGRVRAGETVEVDLDVTAPASAGTYLLEVDVVQEGSAWFADRGSTTARWPVRVSATTGVASDAPAHETPSDESQPVAAAASTYPTFMMRGIPREDVERLVVEVGGEILDEREHRTEWVSYRYVTRRGAEPVSAA